MKSGRVEEFTAVCFAPGCTWEEDHETHQDARAAGDRHEQEHATHLAYVIPGEQDRRAA